jgi:lysophospholipase L1-like esterase
VTSLFRHLRRLGLPVLAGLAVASLAPLGLASADQGQPHVGNSIADATRWVTTWGASPVDMGNFNYSGTIRHVVFTSVGGDTVRVRLTNTFGDQPLQIGDAYIGVSDTDGTILGPNVPLTFSGSRSITIPQGAEALSDPVTLSVPELTDLAVTLYIPHPTEQTGHLGANETTFITYGTDQAGDPTTAGWFSNPSWWFVDSVDVLATHHDTGTVVALGDSITDGAQSTVNANTRWPNDLSRRLDARHGPALSVADEGIAGNQLLQPGAGVAALARFDRDVIDRAGVKDVILLEGINDIGINDAQPAALIAGYEQIIAQAHAAGLRIFGGTLTPFKGAGYWTPEKEQTREAVNRWILTSGAFDGVIDFANATADPTDPQVLNPAYDSGDHLHPNDAGYQAMANAIDLHMLLQQDQH